MPTTPVRIPFKEAARRARANEESRIPPRGEPNHRLEPECWPALRPSFKFTRQDGLFVIGSCFAANIARYLSERRYRVDSLDEFRETPGILNKYTPASIYEEVRWARDILDRDDRMTAADAETCFFRLPDGTVIDTQLHAQEPQSVEAALATREAVYRTYRRLFTADVVVITLGLIEAWYDSVPGRYICETPSRPMVREEGRFQFERLDYATSLDFMEKTYALIRRTNRPRFLITTSPVILTRTFTSDDVLVANMYSKSVLRAVAGRISEADADTDYFPSYESVMLTRKNSVWRDDLLHVAEPFIKQIMLRVEQAYTENVEAEDLEGADAVSRFAGQVASHDYEEARATYAGFAEPLAMTAPEFHTASALLHMHVGDRERARAHLEAELADGASFPNLYAATRVAVGEWLDGPAGRARAIERLHGRNEFTVHHIWKAAQWHAADGHAELSVALLLQLDPASVTLTPMRNQIARMLRRAGQAEAAERFA